MPIHVDDDDDNDNNNNRKEQLLMPSQNLAPGDVLVPRPDPTKLTTDAVRAARVDIEKLFDARLVAAHDLMDEKFKGVASDFAQRDVALKAAFKAAQDAVALQATASSVA